MEAELEAGKGCILVRGELGAAEVGGRGAPVPPRLEHQREPQVRVRRAGEPRRHVKSHLQRFRCPEAILYQCPP